MSEVSQAHVRSGKIMTVLGAIAAADLGPTLMHEHILNDCRCWWNKPNESERQYLAHQRVNPAILGELRMDPFVNLDNCALDDEAAAIEELKPVAALGGRSVVDPTCRGIGRDPRALARIAAATGLNIVMGAGYYLQSSHPKHVADMSADAIADEIVAEAIDGVDGSGVRIGLIGEIGVSSLFTTDEEKSLRGAVRAQRRTKLPLMVHLPAWFRLAHRVLDIVEEEGGDVAHTVLCHMNPSGADAAYQNSVAERGAFLEYDMIGMDYWYADQQVQCPSDEENAAAIKGLIDAGFLDRILLSQDIFLKMMLTRHGGFGYAYVQRHFLPRLQRHGVTSAQCAALMTDNPRAVFSAS
jgi:phosphotriesterase-related protein